jgi:hypothetical protein
MAGKEAARGRAVDREGEAVGPLGNQGAPQREAVEEAELRDSHGHIRLHVALPVAAGKVRVVQKSWERRGACHGHELGLEVDDGGVALHVQHDGVARERLHPIGDAVDAREHVHVQLQAVEGGGGFGSLHVLAFVPADDGLGVPLEADGLEVDGEADRRPPEGRWGVGREGGGVERVENRVVDVANVAVTRGFARCMAVAGDAGTRVVSRVLLMEARHTRNQDIS